MVNATTAGLVGVVLLARHGDRTEYNQDPYTYNSTQGYLTPLGSVQQFELGSFLRSTYLNPDSPSYIQGISADVVDIDQLFVRADSGGGNVILDSAYALLQGLYPPSPQTSFTLANGTVVVPPLGGYQYVPVESLEFWQAPSLTSWMDCNYFQLHLARANQTAEYLNASSQALPFLESVRPYLNGISNNFTNMWNIYDYINVRYTHNKTFYENLPETLLYQARHFANIHQELTFTDGVQLQNGIGQIAIRTVLPEIFASLTNMTVPENKVKLAITELDYKQFISLFNVTNATTYDPEVVGIPDYNSVVALELSKDTDHYEVSMKFKNGTNDKDFRQLKLFGNTSITLPELIQQLDWTTVNTTMSWCFSCNQTTLRGCSAYNFSQDPFISGDRP
ncbi:hypothetical protein HYDPIDRAFT_155693 [Hydnomerulius pinastri MD-312]|uniref:Acid phosphatase n=1 Tax=Hydnomerulius pinastri MD-312 TaxID=994086 RepID=A0A0C9VDD5_9AGAM|nr:hypothetical protein HYDPIDRAFT_155693 [Hydnomerulius pinastri MD-312]